MTFKSPLRSVQNYRFRRDLLAKGQIPEINMVCPAITPTLGAELLTDPGFDTGVDWTLSGNWAIAASKATQTPGGAGSVYFTTLVAGWYLLQLDVVTHTANNLYRQVEGGASGAINAVATYYGVGQASAPSTWGAYGDATCNAELSGASLKKYTFATMLAYLGTRGQQNGTYTCTPTIGTMGTETGLVIEYKDANNFVLATYWRVSNRARLYKCDGGTVTRLLNVSVAYGAGNALAVVVDGQNHSLYYNGVQQGATQVIDNSGMGKAVYGFNSYAGNTVGTVTTTA